MWAWVSELLDNAGNFEMIDIGAFLMSCAIGHITS